MDTLLSKAMQSGPRFFFKDCKVAIVPLYESKYVRIGDLLEFDEIDIKELIDKVSKMSVPRNCAVEVYPNRYLSYTLGINTHKTGYYTLKGNEWILEESMQSGINITYYYFKRLKEDRNLGCIPDIFNEAVLDKVQIATVHGLPFEMIPSVNDNIQKLMGSDYAHYQEVMKGIIEDFQIWNMDIQLHYLVSTGKTELASDVIKWMCKIYNCEAFSKEPPKRFITQYNMDGSVTVLASDENRTPVIVLRGNSKGLFDSVSESN